MTRPSCPTTRAGRRPWHPAVALVLAGLLLATGCAKPPAKDLQPGSYRAVLELPGERTLPFGLDVAREEHGFVLYVLNGPERIRVSEVEAGPGTVKARFPGYETTLEASITGGTLRGHVTLVHPDDRTLSLPFEATLGQTWRFYEEPLNDNADVAGRWAVTLAGATGPSTQAVAELTQRFEQVTGTVVLPADDQRYLAGEVHDEELRLSRFDGGAAMLYTAKLDAQGRLVGEFWSDRGGVQRFTARREPDADVDATAIASHLRDPDAPFTFSFAGPDGVALSSADASLAGKVLLVTLAGSWCPNSHDEAVLLVRLDRKYRDRGLAVVSLMFEQHTASARAAAAIGRFRHAHGIGYPTLLAGPADKARASQALPQLDAVRAYPTAVFIDRQGHVRKVHTGFAGPATGVRHELLVQEFEQTLEQLLGEGDRG